MRILLGMLFVLFLAGCSTAIDDPLSVDSTYDLFGERMEYKLIERRDFGGFDLYGSRFMLYEYSLSSIDFEKTGFKKRLRNFPLFKNGYFRTRELLDSSRAVKWKQLPVKMTTDSLIFLPLYSYLDVSSRVNRKYLSDSTNLYSFISDGHLGNCAFLLIPEKKRLYIVIKSD